MPKPAPISVRIAKRIGLSILWLAVLYVGALMILAALSGETFPTPGVRKPRSQKCAADSSAGWGMPATHMGEEMGGGLA